MRLLMLILTGGDCRDQCASMGSRPFIKARLRRLASFERFLLDRSASTAVVFATAIVPLFISIGVAVDFSRAHSAKSALQAVADQAAMFGASQFRGNVSKASEIEVKVNAFITSSLDLKHLSGAANPNVTVSVDMIEREVAVSLNAPMPTTLMALADYQTIDVGVSARAAANESPVNVCVLALDPYRINAVYMKGSGQVAAPKCWFWANSSVQSQAMMFQGSFQSVAAGYCSAGDHLIQSALVSPKPTDFCDPVADPFADWTPPLMPATCNYGVQDGAIVGMTLNISGTVTLSPGRYCGPIKVNGGNVVLQPGRYFFSDGTVTFSTSGEIVGEAVYLHFGGSVPNYSITASTALRLYATTDARLQRIVIYKEPTFGGKSKSSATGNSDTYIDGAIYLPGDDFLLAGNTKVHADKAETSIVALGVEIQGNTYFEITPDPDFQAQGDFRTVTAVRLLPQ